MNKWMNEYVTISNLIVIDPLLYTFLLMYPAYGTGFSPICSHGKEYCMLAMFEDVKITLIERASQPIGSISGQCRTLRVQVD